MECEGVFIITKDVRVLVVGGGVDENEYWEIINFIISPAGGHSGWGDYEGGS